jgi:hypothetical protein
MSGYADHVQSGGGAECGAAGGVAMTLLVLDLGQAGGGFTRAASGWTAN